MYLDVYTDVIPAGSHLFVSKGRIFADIFRNLFRVVVGSASPIGKKLNGNLLERFLPPPVLRTTPNGNNSTRHQRELADASNNLPPTRAGGLNISFVLDSIMCPERGLRPLDLETFAHNDESQPLRIVSSAVEVGTGRLKSVCLGSREGRFRDGFSIPRTSSARDVDDDGGDRRSLYPELESAEADENGHRRGLWASLGASMTVPGAAGSPFRMDLPSSSSPPSGGLTPHLCFDAFCYEPVPFRSAVAEGATHVLALRSRPAGFEPKTKPTLYERAVAPLYFRSNDSPTVAEFFERGGQQYLYAEDVLLCDKGLNSTEAIPIPPAKVLYAAPEEDDDESSSIRSSERKRENWSRAHLLPIAVAADVPELSTLSDNRDDILAAIRHGFAAAFDALAPVVGLEQGPDALDGMGVAELVFPDADAPHDDESVLEKQLLLAGEKLGRGLRTASTRAGDASHDSGGTDDAVAAEGADLSSAPHRGGRFRRLGRVRRAFRLRHRGRGDRVHNNNIDEANPLPLPLPVEVPASLQAHGADKILSFLPGLQIGSLPLVQERLQAYLEKISYIESS